MAIVTDITEGNGGRNSLQGWELHRIFTVSELSSAGYAMIVEAKAALSAAGVDIGSEHPEVKLPLYTPAYVQEIDFESIPTAGNQVKATAIYRQFDTNYKYTIDGGMQSVDTDEYYPDPTDPTTVAKMELQYSFPANYGGNPAYVKNSPIKQIKRNSIQFPMPVITIRRTERYSIAADTLSGGRASGVLLSTAGYGADVFTDRNLNFAGYTNLAGWNIRPNDAAGVWLCLGISADSQDNGLSYQVTYRFQADSWKRWAFRGNFENPETNEIPDDIVDGVGSKDFHQYPSRSFGYLELS